MKEASHTGRSRNDQVALDMKLYVRDEIQETDMLLKELETLFKINGRKIYILICLVYTFKEKAQPITAAHHFGAYFEMFKRDRAVWQIQKRD